MRFRPCIDIHNGAVKQIVGGSLSDLRESARENFVSEHSAAHFAAVFRKLDLPGGHIVILNHRDSAYYEATRKEALSALSAYPGGLQVGGGIDPDNASEYLEAGASHVIVTSYVFHDGCLDREALDRMEEAVGRNRLVLDLSCRYKNGCYYIVTDRWQKDTDCILSPELLRDLGEHCDEFLVHATNVEGLRGGIETGVVKILTESPIRATYAGGIGCMEDIDLIYEEGKGMVDFTVGSALTLYGGDLDPEAILRRISSLK